MSISNEREQDLCNAIALAVRNRFGARILSLEITREIDDDGADIIRVDLSLAVDSANWKKGAMLDLVSLTAGVLRKNGETSIPYVLAKRSELARSHAH